ncbi:MAG: gamma-glutamylcyclotransferase [Verrucomicrobiales bacterium]|nr:gamma-glutamylcyclotransferase [Verrucomicrobiales bacterium]
MSTVYFAYGSNLVLDQMAQRCPHSRPLETAVLDDWRFRINAAGWATILPEAGARVHGLLWTLTSEDETALDLYEEMPSGLYEKRRLNVRTHSEEPREAMVYLALDPTPGTPTARYWDPIESAAEACGFPPEYLAELRRWRPVRS